MDELELLRALAVAMGVQTTYTDGLGRDVEVGPETLIRVCAALGAQIGSPAHAPEALRALHESSQAQGLPPVIIAWDGVVVPVPVAAGTAGARLFLESGAVVRLAVRGAEASTTEHLPPGYHRLTVETAAGEESCTVISAPERAWRRPGSLRSWGVGTHLAALRSARSRSLGDLKDLEVLCRWIGSHGGDLVTLLPLLPTFNDIPAEPSPYSPVSRLFWSELMLDLGAAHRPTAAPATLDVTRADAEVRAALRGVPTPDVATLDRELLRYARFRGAQARLGRNWRDWPADARNGTLRDEHVDADEERFHLVAQTMVRSQLRGLLSALGDEGVRIGLDLAVGAHPDGYDTWSRPSLFAGVMAVGAPPDPGFPSGQDWGFSPVLPDASRREGHRYLAASVAHQAHLCGVLRIDHVMAWTRLYWIPHGMALHEGTYVAYPAEELFAILTLESHRNRCEVVGENLGTVPVEIDEALPRHRIWGMFLAEFEAMADDPTLPTDEQVSLIGTHDTPTLAGWIAGVDIDERVRCGLLHEEAAPAEREARAAGAERLAELLDATIDDLPTLLSELLDWMGRSPSPLVTPWLEDLWLEVRQVNLPGTRSSERPNWQRPMSRLLDQVMADPEIDALLRHLDLARAAGPTPP